MALYTYRESARLMSACLPFESRFCQRKPLVPLGISWSITVSVPQLEALIALGEILVDSVQAIKDEMARLADGQADQTEALATQLEAIVTEMQQFTAQDITQAQLDNLLSAVT